MQHVSRQACSLASHDDDGFSRGETSCNAKLTVISVLMFSFHRAFLFRGLYAKLRSSDIIAHIRRRASHNDGGFSSTT